MDIPLAIETLRRSWRKLAAVFLAALLSGFLAATLRPALYQAQSEVDVSTLFGGSGTQGGSLSPMDADRRIANELVVANGEEVAQRAGKSLHASDLPAVRKLISVAQLPNTDILGFTATEPDPRKAVKVAEAFAAAYTELSAQRVRQTAAAQANALQPRLTELAARLARFTGSSRTDLLIRASLTDQYASLIRKQQDLQTQATLAMPLPVVAPTAPTAPIGRSAGLLAILAAGLALLLCGLYLIIRARYDDAVRTLDDLDLHPNDRLIAFATPRRVAGVRCDLPAGGARHRLITDAAVMLCLESPLPRVVAVVALDAAASSGSLASELVSEMATAGTRVIGLSAQGSEDIAPLKGGEVERAKFLDRVPRPTPYPRPTTGEARPSAIVGSRVVSSTVGPAGLVARRNELSYLRDRSECLVVDMMWDEPGQLREAASTADHFLLYVYAGRTLRRDVKSTGALIRSLSSVPLTWLFDPGLSGDGRL